MKFFVDVNGSPVNQGMPIQVKVRSASEEPGVYSAILLCLSKGNDIECAIECDSGSAPAAWAANIANDGVVFKAQGFTLHGVCGESENTVFVTPHDDNLKLRHVQCPRNP